MAARIGIDLGGTKIDALALAGDGAVTFEKRIETPQGYDDIVVAIAELIREAGPGVVGVGAPGSASPRGGLWRNANIVVLNGRPFAADLAAAAGRDLRLENDANCFALSEAIDGAGQGHGIVAFFTIGTALGGGLVIDGHLRTGPNAEAAEFGHTPLPWPTPDEWPPLPCFCGKSGCAEQYVSGTGLARDYERRTGAAIKGREIVSRARAGEAAATAALSCLQDRFARVVANILNVIDPDIHVIGGGLSGLRELVEDLPPVVARYSFSGTANAKIVRARHGEKSGVRGAVFLAGQGLSQRPDFSDRK